MTLTGPDAEPRFLLPTNWEGYLKILDAVSGIRVTYRKGLLELMSPGVLRDRTRDVITALVDCLMEETGVNGESGGSTTFRRKILDRGLEPDQCWWIENATLVLGEEDSDPEVLPIPDLVIEVEVTQAMLDKLEIYASLGVPEIWRWQAGPPGSLEVLTLSQPGVYEPVRCSRMFPRLPAEDLTRFVRRGLTEAKLHAVRHFREWVRQYLT